MHFEHAPVIWREFAAPVPGLRVAGDIRPDVELGAMVDPWYARARQRLGTSLESELAEVAARSLAAARVLGRSSASVSGTEPRRRAAGPGR